MWVVVALLLLILLGTFREGMTDGPAEAAEKQRGDVNFLKEKINDVSAVVSQEEIDKRLTEMTAFDEKVTDLDLSMKQYTESKKVNDTMGYPEI